MKKLITTALLCAGLGFAATETHAQTPIKSCPSKFLPALVHLRVSLSTNTKGCPLLEDKRFANFVKKNAIGKVFAYPAVPCLSGVVIDTETGSSTVTVSGRTYNVTGSQTESAQLFDNTALAQVDPDNSGLLLTGQSGSNIAFVSGFAATVAALKDPAQKFNLTVLSFDNFTVNLSNYPFKDKEVLRVVDGDGLEAVGELHGDADLYGNPTDPWVNQTMDVDGVVCIKF